MHGFDRLTFEQMPGKALSSLLPHLSLESSASLIVMLQKLLQISAAKRSTAAALLEMPIFANSKQETMELQSLLQPWVHSATQGLL